MGISSAAESKLEASIRPEITVMRTRTSYPRRHRPALAALAGAERDGGADSTPIVRVLAEVADSGPVTARLYRTSASFTSARTVRTASSAVSARAARTTHSDRPAGPVGGDGVIARRTESARAPVRLTRRGRFIVGVLAGLAIVSAVALIWLAVTGQAQAASKVTPGRAANHGMLRVVVRPGQTLWNIAEKADPSADPRLVIQQIIEDNALGGTAVNAGQVLWVPAS